MPKRQRMTEQEIADAVESSRLCAIHQDAVRRTEQALDDIGAYLKATKRKRPAPTMMFQYIGFRDSDFMRLVATFEEANEAQDRSQHDWLHRDKVIQACCYCKARTATVQYGAENGGPEGTNDIISPIGTAFAWEEMEILLTKHFQGAHERVIYDDCPECAKERDET
jgi:hypothetical protein